MGLSTGEYLGIVGVLLAHTAMLAFWGGSAWRLLKSHDREIASLRTWKHDEIAPTLTDLLVRVGILENEGGQEK